MPVSIESGDTFLRIGLSVALGLLILAAVLQLFTASRQSYRFQQNVARMQENARIAVEVLQRSVRDVRCSLERSLAVLAHAKKVDPKVYTKSSIMVGLGETLDEVRETMRMLRDVGGSSRVRSRVR